MENRQEFEFNWDSEIQHDGEGFELLPEGDCDFEVKGFERGRHNGSDKMPPCPKAIVSIRVTNAEGRSTTIRHNLLLHSRCEGLLCEFFTAIGHRRHGERLKMDWNRVAGCRGRCRVGVRTFTSNRTGEEMKTNEIKRFYDPAKDPAKDQPPQQPQQPQQTSFGGGFAAGGFAGGFKGGAR